MSSDDAGMNSAMNSTATAPSANAIGMPENMTTSVTSPNRGPDDSTLIGGPSGRERHDDLQQELQREQRHAGAHQPVRDRQRRRPGRGECSSSTQASWNSVHDFQAKNAQNSEAHQVDQHQPDAVGARRKQRRDGLDADVPALRLHDRAAQKDGADDAEHRGLVLPVGRALRK